MVRSDGCPQRCRCQGRADAYSNPALSLTSKLLWHGNADIYLFIYLPIHLYLYI